MTVLVGPSIPSRAAPGLRRPAGRPPGALLPGPRGVRSSCCLPACPAPARLPSLARPRPRRRPWPPRPRPAPLGLRGWWAGGALCWWPRGAVSGRCEEAARAGAPPPAGLGAGRRPSLAAGARARAPAAGARRRSAPAARRAGRPAGAAGPPLALRLAPRAGPLSARHAGVAGAWPGQLPGPGPASGRGSGRPPAPASPPCAVCCRFPPAGSGRPRGRGRALPPGAGPGSGAGPGVGGWAPLPLAGRSASSWVRCAACLRTGPPWWPGASPRARAACPAAVRPSCPRGAAAAGPACGAPSRRRPGPSLRVGPLRGWAKPSRPALFCSLVPAPAPLPLPRSFRRPPLPLRCPWGARAGWRRPCVRAPEWRRPPWRAVGPAGWPGAARGAEGGGGGGVSAGQGALAEEGACAASGWGPWEALRVARGAPRGGWARGSARGPLRLRPG